MKDHTYNYHPDSFGYLNMPVLSQLWGREFDEPFVAFIWALRPSEVVINMGGIKADNKLWRVHVVLNENNRVVRVTQTVEVSLPANVENGGELLHLVPEMNPPFVKHIAP